MKQVRGMRETSSLQGRRGSGLPPSLSQLATQLSRLEHQRTLLERQLAVWTEKKDMTAHRIGFLAKQIAALERQLWAGRKRPRVAGGSNASPGVVRRRSQGPGPAMAARREMPFEY